MNLEKLIGPISLEKKRGCKNDSVIGGFDRFVFNTINSIEDVTIATKLRELFENYSRLDSGARLTILNNALDFIRVHSKGEETVVSLKKQKISDLFVDVQYAKGIGPHLSKLFQKLNIKYVYDLLYYFPKNYLDLRNVKRIYELQSGEVALLRVKIRNVEERKGRVNLLIALATDGTGYITAVWFNQPYLKNIFKVDMEVYLFGKVQFSYGKWEMPSPGYEIIEKNKELLHTMRIIPVYSLTEGLSEKVLRSKMKGILDSYASHIFDYIDDAVLKRNDFIDLGKALMNIHFPESFVLLKKAKERLIFNELFELQYVLGRRKHEIAALKGYVFKTGEDDINRFRRLLPFELTNDQVKVMKELIGDFSKGHPMNRLLHGDVGSGKTVVALFAIFVTVKNNFQAAMMSPTEILALQTYKNALSIFKDTPIKIALITSSTGKKERNRILDALLNNEIHAVFGTHALLEEDVRFANLGLVVVDEQHRFGVLQRGILREKAVIPHTLVMSATPIPRTLALTLYGDLDISEIREMPKGRKPVITKVFFNDRDTAYSLVKEELDKGYKAYVVCPLIEDSEALEVQSVESLYEELKDTYFKKYKIGKLYGSMSGKEKEEVMDAFRKGEIQLLVSTTVVEVGVDVKDATVIVVEDADRFGLATLHQLRGRVGRSDLQSYCFLISSNPSMEAVERLRILEKTTNGFEVAEEDLRLRGPGEILGTRQSGLPEFKLMTLLSESNMRILEVARKEAFLLLKGESIFDREKLEELERIIERKFGWKIPLIEVA